MTAVVSAIHALLIPAVYCSLFYVATFLRFYR